MNVWGKSARVLSLGCMLGALLFVGCNSAQQETERASADAVTESADAVTESADASGDLAEEIPETISVTISATGDCALGKLQIHGYDGSFCAYYDTYGADYFMENVRDIFAADDFTVVNLECVLTNETTRVEKTYNIKGYPEYTAILTGGSIEACSLGNNHSADYGTQSLVDTEEALEAAGVGYAIDDVVGTYTTEDGILIGYVSVNLLSQSAEKEAYLQEGIEDLRERCDLVLALCHWGVEHVNYLSDYQVEMAHQCVDWGADLVIGNHPHVLQGIELYNGKVICYSLGNFCFGANRNPDDKETLIYQQTFTFVDGALQDMVDATILPCALSSHTSYNDYQPMLLTGEDGQTVISHVNEYSENYCESGIFFDEDGTLKTE